MASPNIIDLKVDGGWCNAVVPDWGGIPPQGGIS